MVTINLNEYLRGSNVFQFQIFCNLGPVQIFTIPKVDIQIGENVEEDLADLGICQVQTAWHFDDDGCNVMIDRFDVLDRMMEY